MRYPDLKKPFYIACDASILSLGASLHHRHAHHKIHLVALSHKPLRPNKPKQTIAKSETLALVPALKAFHTYTKGFRTLKKINHGLCYK